MIIVSGSKKKGVGRSLNSPRLKECREMGESKGTLRGGEETCENPIVRREFFVMETKKKPAVWKGAVGS